MGMTFHVADLLIVGGLSVLVGGIIGFWLGLREQRSAWHHELIRRGHGGYDWDTGIWRWKEPPPEVVNKHDEG